jgi:hypothetical protein
MESCTKLVNVVIFAETEDMAKSTADLFGTKQSGVDLWEGTQTGVPVKTYIRWFSSVPTQTPKGVTDILVVACNSVSGEVTKYIDQRRGIPQKYLVSESDLKTDAGELKVDYLSKADLVNGGVTKLIESANALTETLKNVFNKIDLNGNGTLTYDEIIKASTELNHVLTTEDAKEIAATLSTDGKINFAQFKQWWVTGRADLRSFRRLVALEMKVNNFLKSEKGVSVTSLFEKLKKESEEAAAQETSLDNKVNIVPVTDFESGTALRLHLNLGNSFDSISENIGKTGSVGKASIELKLKNPEAGNVVIETLNQVKEMAKQFIPDADQFIDKDAVISFRQVGESVFIDVSYEGENAEMLCFGLSMLGISSINFSGQSDLHICSKVSPVDALTANVDSLLDNGSSFKVDAHGEYSHLKNLVTFAQSLFDMFGKGFAIGCGSGGQCEQLIKSILSVAQLLTASRKIDFGMKYDSESLSKFIKEQLDVKKEGHDHTKYEKICSKWTETQAKINGGVDSGKMMAGMFLAPFLPAITNINWDTLSVSVCSQLVRAHIKLSLSIRGLDEFVTNFLG